MWWQRLGRAHLPAATDADGTRDRRTGLRGPWRRPFRYEYRTRTLLCSSALRLVYKSGWKHPPLAQTGGDLNVGGQALWIKGSSVETDCDFWSKESGFNTRRAHQRQASRPTITYKTHFQSYTGAVRMSDRKRRSSACPKAQVHRRPTVEKAASPTVEFHTPARAYNIRSKRACMSSKSKSPNRSVHFCRHADAT